MCIFRQRTAILKRDSKWQVMVRKPFSKEWNYYAGACYWMKNAAINRAREMGKYKGELNNE